jgi:PIN domain nuclease of toxin-antitoxin system
MNHVLDACAMIAYLRGEAGANVVADLLSDVSQPCFAHTVNLCEVFYDFVRETNVKTARSAVRDLKSVGIRAFSSFL